MPPILTIGIIIFVGFIFGEIIKLVKLPKITGYILAGILLNPGISHFIPESFVTDTNIVTNIALAFISFSVGGTLFYPTLKRLGKKIFSITIFEAEFAFLFILAGMLFLAPKLVHLPQAGWLVTFVPLSLLLASLGSPTDPSATLAVKHEYNAKGDVSSTIMGVAAFDDATGIINYSIAMVISAALIGHQAATAAGFILKPLLLILGSLVLGIMAGSIFNLLTRAIKRDTEGALIVSVFALIMLCFGVARVLGVDELLAAMAMGAVVVNFNQLRQKIFAMLERYTEELIFVLFFTISGMHLDFSVMGKFYFLIIAFVIFRTLGKFTGVFVGAALSKASLKVKKYTAGGLIPQGGIVVGLALIIQQNLNYSPLAAIIMNVTIGATVIHELIGPLVATFVLRRAGEIKSK